MANETIWEKLIEAQKVMTNPIQDSEGRVKTKSGYEYTYRYASYEAIQRVVKGALKIYDLFLTQGVIVDNGRQYLKTTVYDKNGNSVVLDVRFMPELTNPQQLGSFQTYMMRYSLLAAFALVGAEDDDGAIVAEQEQNATSQDEAKEAGQALGDAINVYCAITGSKPEVIRKNIREKLAQTNEGKNPEALKREAENLHMLARMANGDV